MERASLETVAAPASASSSASSSAAPSRTNSYNKNLQTLEAQSSAQFGNQGFDFNALTSSFGEGPAGTNREVLIDNPLAQLLSIRATIRTQCQSPPSLGQRTSSFPNLLPPLAAWDKSRFNLSSRTWGSSES